jgi:hypothetical protein
MGSSSRRAAAKAYYDNVLMSSSNEDSDGETELLIAAVGMVNEHFLMPPCRGGSSKKRDGTSIAIEKLTMIASTRTNSRRQCATLQVRNAKDLLKNKRLLGRM